MNILYIVPYVPSHIYVRPYNLIKQITSHGHRVTVITISTNKEDNESAHHLRNFCHQVIEFPLPTWRSYVNSLLAIPSSKPLQSVYCWLPDLVHYAIELIEKHSFDIIHIEHLRGARYGLEIKERLYASNGESHSTPIIWDSVDCITHLFKQSAKHSTRQLSKFITTVEIGRTARYEAKLITEFDRILVTSRADKDAMLSLPNSRKITPNIAVLPNGVDLDYFQPGNGKSRDNETLVITGKMSYHANVAMVTYLVNDIMPIVWSQKPSVHVWIVGKNPPQSIISFGNNPAITVTGSVDDLRPFLQQATISVAPLRYGAGIQNKVLEAMACATPVITSSQGVNALNINVDEEIIIGDTPKSFAKAIINLLENPQIRDRIGKAGRRYVERNHDWSSIVDRLEDIYVETINQNIRSS